MMKRIYCFLEALLASVAVSSCGDPVYMGTPYINGGTDETVIPELPEKKSLYMTGIEYPAGYNWLPELGSGSVEAVMFLMKDGKRIQEITVGTKYLVSADADMHRNIGDDLFTDYSTDDETVIKRNGIELFRYPDREMIHSMLVEGGDVYTLGRPRSGSGFTYRRNGEIVITKGSANIVSGLYKDGEHIVFAYEDVIKSATDTRYKYYCVVDDIAKVLAVASDVMRVDDIRVIDGAVHYIAVFANRSYRIYYAGDESFELKRAGASSLSGCVLLHGGGKVFVKGRAPLENVFWYGADILSYSQNTNALDWCADKENVYHITSTSSSQISLKLRRNGMVVNLPAHYMFIYSGCMDAYDGQCCIAAVNQGNRNSPVLWVDESVTEYDFNGLFTSVSYQ